MVAEEQEHALPSEQVILTTPDEDAADFAREVADLMGGMSAEEFIQRLDSGEWDEVIDDPEYWHVLRLALFADVVRPRPPAPVPQAAEPEPPPADGAAPAGSDQIFWLAPDAAKAELSRRVAAAMDGMSADEFLRRLDSGEWDEVMAAPGSTARTPTSRA